MKRELADGYELDDDPGRIDIDAVHSFISGESYWGQGRPRAMVETVVRKSDRVVGLYKDSAQVGFCRAVIDDGARVAYLADVYVLAEHRHLYVVLRPERAGQALVTLFVDDLDGPAIPLALLPSLTGFYKLAGDKHRLLARRVRVREDGPVAIGHVRAIRHKIESITWHLTIPSDDSQNVHRRPLSARGHTGANKKMHRKVPDWAPSPVQQAQDPASETQGYHI